MDFSLSPWTTIGKPSAIKASVDDLSTKNLHCTALDDPVSKNPPRPKAWTIVQSKKWLKDNAITQPPRTMDNVVFILQTSSEHQVVAEAAAEDKAQEARGLLSSSHCIGKYPDLHLIHALVDHAGIKRAFSDPS